MVYEGSRTEVTERTWIRIRFTQRHDVKPNVTAMLETTDSSINCFTSDLSQTHVTVNFSSEFSGYLHLHACSQQTA